MKKTAALMVMALAVVMVSQPAMAGVGGCRIPGVGGCGGSQISANAPETRTPSVLDSLAGALPADVALFLKALFEAKGGGVVQEPVQPTNEGVGGCRFPGVGGCACQNGIC